jgi:hypothetical protein
MSVRKITYRDKEIIVIDYSGQKEDEMIQTVSEAIKLIHALEKPALLLSIFNEKNYGTPKFLRYLEAEIKATEEVIFLPEKPQSVSRALTSDT